MFAILIDVLAVKLCSPIVRTKRPEAGVNTALETSYPLIGDAPTLTVITPLCLRRPFVLADLNTWVDVSEDIPTVISNVFVAALATANHPPLAISNPDLGY